MTRRLIVLTAAALAIAPAVASAQIGVAGRVGTLGIGAEGAIGLFGNLVARGGIGVMPLEIDGSSLLDADDITADLELPKTWYNIGGDLYLGGGFRIGGGMLFKPDDPTVTAALTPQATIDIGDGTYTGSDVAQVVGTLDSADSAPYLLIGFGRHTNTGFGLFLDLGVAFLGEPEVLLEATEGNSAVIDDTTFQARLRQEETNVEEEVGTYLNYWPIVSIGLKLGIG